MTECPVPGNDHPAVAHLRDTIITSSRDLVLIAVPQSVRLDSVSALTPTSAAIQTLEFRHQRAAQGFFPEYGMWMWDVWTDQYGRSVVGEARWEPNPDAFVLPPFGLL